MQLSCDGENCVLPLCAWKLAFVKCQSNCQGKIYINEFIFTCGESYYHILPVNSRSYYKFQVEIGAATNRDFNIEIACKV